MPQFTKPVETGRGEELHCSGQNGNISSPPQFVTGYRLAPTSPCLDTGLSALLYLGQPATDLAGDLRLRDFDGDGLAHADMGAFEETNATLTPAEVTDLMWTGPLTLVWDAVSGATEYHVYRGASPFGYTDFGLCVDPLDAVRTDQTLMDAGAPPPGQVWSYILTAEDGVGREGTLGFGTSAERSRFMLCP